MKRKGWFRIPGVQDGERTLEEQLLGLEDLLAAVVGKVVLDLGSAEGLIAQRVADAGAKLVHGIEVMRPHVEAARAMAGKRALHFHVADLNDPAVHQWLMGLDADVVLMLAVLHKLHDPRAALKALACCARERIVIRLPIGSQGQIQSKHFRRHGCDVNATLQAQGFQLEQSRPGPNTELVQYWRRTA